MKPEARVPVVMYHSVGPAIPDWEWHDTLTVPPRVFHDHLLHLSKAGYRTATLGELYDHMAGIRPLSGKCVVLTFDDGYLDNWTFAAPLLKRFGFTGTVYVNPEFVDPRDVVRPTLENVPEGGVSEADLEVRGFMSWAELRRLGELGTLDVQSHLMTHTWYPSGPRVIDFHRPGAARYWLDWNRYGEDKPYYLRSPGRSRVRWGTPVYEHAKSMEGPMYLPDPAESEALADFVERSGGEVFFDDPAWRERLFGHLDAFRKGRTPGSFESPEACRERFRHELEESKRLLETHLGKAVDFLAWPGGGYCDESFRMARTVYKSVTLDKAHRFGRGNTPGEDPYAIARVGVPEIEKKGKVFFPGGRYFVKSLDEFRKVPLARLARRVMKLHYVLSCAKGSEDS